MAVTRIREYRTLRGMTVRELADRAGVSTGLISQVERGVTDPSLETMRRIAEALDTPLFNLFQEGDQQTVAVIRRDDRYRISSPHHAITYTRASPGGARLEVLEGSLEPGAVSSDTPRSHPSEECVVVLTGRLTVQVGDQTHVLKAGDSCHFDSNIPHRFRNESRSTVRFMLSITPPSY
ncbi:helix-turn-helix domain-containing protein [Streptomyces asiaticus]|uniref:helix-turn-helix domain-containing protein n=1 Tax=Streptomyces TaxID=1883 RepID=UPI0015FE3040|nr:MULTISPECIES: XRE family transcriptional regulator [unclassified Streptomyces]MBA6440631.1 helix-turn-helix transcriptional regulator [Streptomyces sp. GMR22]MBD3002597.1 helix-turn-helix transcriptional regulator [Streptomyces sp. 5-10]